MESSLLELLNKQAAKLGGGIVFEKVPAGGVVSFKQQLKEIEKESEAPVVYVVVYHDDRNGRCCDCNAKLAKYYDIIDRNPDDGEDLSFYSGYYCLPCWCDLLDFEVPARHQFGKLKKHS